MASHDSLLIRHALAVLKEFAEGKADEPGPAVQLALRALSPYADSYQLGVFWRIAQNDGGLPRRGNLLKSLEVISDRLAHHTAGP